MDFSANYFQGAAVFLLSDGTGNDGYASYDTDWYWFGLQWLNNWDNFATPPVVLNPASILEVVGIDGEGSDIRITWTTIGGKTNDAMKW